MKISSRKKYTVLLISLFQGLFCFGTTPGYFSSEVIKGLFKLDMKINENALFATLKDLGQNDASKMRGLLLLKNEKLLQKSGPKSIILDADSIVK